MGSYTPIYGFYIPDESEDGWHNLVGNNFNISEDKIVSSSLTNITVSSPLSKSANLISLTLDTANMQVYQGTKLSTIQGINTNSSPTFYSLHINNDVYIGANSSEQALLFVSGVAWIKGDILTQANNYVFGNSFVTGSSYISGSTYQSGSVFATTMIGTKKLYVNKYEQPPTGSGWSEITASEEDQFNLGVGTPPNIDFYVSGATELRGNILITGSVNINGTMYVPTIDFGGGVEISKDGDTISISTNGTSSFTNLETEFLAVGQTSSFGNNLKIIPRFVANTVYSDLNFRDDLALISFNTDSPFDISTININASYINLSGSATANNYHVKVHLGNLTSPPTATGDGDTYHDPSNSRGYIYTSGSWRQIYP